MALQNCLSLSMFYVPCQLASAHTSSDFMTAEKQEVQILVAMSSSSLVQVEVDLEVFG